MIPLYDSTVRRRKFPVVNIALIVVNSLVFLYELTLGGIDRDIFFFTFGLMPVELTQGISFQVLPLRDALGNVVELKDIETPFHTWGTVFTSMFMHGGFMHFIGNMLFLWVFGDNVEERLGHVKYLLFYVAAGVAAAWAQIGIDLDSQIPMIGASGAISGVLGAYLMLYPYNRITTLVIFVFITVIQLPALLVLGAWFLLQLVNGLGSIGTFSSGAGVAYMAHIGGFGAGMVLMALYKFLTGEPVWPSRPWDYNPWRLRR